MKSQQMSRRSLRFSLFVVALLVASAADAQRPARPSARPAQTNASALGQRVDSARVAWVPDPRAVNDGRVADPSRHLRPATVAALNDTIRALERATGAQMAVVVVDSTAGLEPSDFALNLLRYWGVGSRERNDGLLFLWVPARRAIHITVGDGLEGVLPDARVGRIQDAEVIPAFRRGDFDEGVLRGVSALAAAARQESAAAAAANRGRRAEAEASTAISQPPPARRPSGGLVALLGVGVLGLVGGLGWLAFRLRRPPSCPDGHGPMRLVPDEQDDALLSQAEQAEERVRSVDHKVWVCDQCGIRRKTANRKLFTSYGNCPACGRRTMLSQTQVLQHPTQFSEGVQLITQHCEFCGRTDRRRQSLPRVVVTSSSGGGGSSSFGGGGGSSGGGSSWGGGSSRGGGAGRSY